MGQHLKKRQTFLFFAFLFGRTFKQNFTWTRHKFSFSLELPAEGKRTCVELLGGEKMINQLFKNVDVASFWRGNMLFYRYLSSFILLYVLARPEEEKRTTDPNVLLLLAVNRRTNEPWGWLSSRPCWGFLLYAFSLYCCVHVEHELFFAWLQC